MDNNQTMASTLTMSTEPSRRVAGHQCWLGCGWCCFHWHSFCGPASWCRSRRWGWSRRWSWSWSWSWSWRWSWGCLAPPRARRHCSCSSTPTRRARTAAATPSTSKHRCNLHRLARTPSRWTLNASHHRLANKLLLQRWYCRHDLPSRLELLLDAALTHTFHMHHTASTKVGALDGEHAGALWHLVVLVFMYLWGWWWWSTRSK